MRPTWHEKLKTYSLPGLNFSIDGVSYLIIGTRIEDDETIDTFKNVETGEWWDISRNKLGEKLINALHR